MPIDIHNDSIEVALKKLKARENALRQLEAISRLGSWEVDLKTNKSHWSNRSYEIYGFKPGEIEPSLDIFFQAVLPEYVQQAKDMLAYLRETKEVGTLQTRIRRKDGEIRDVVINAQVVYDESGAVEKLVGTTQDITKYVNLQRRSKELLEILERSSNEIYIIDIENYRYLYVNEGAAKRLGYSKKELAQMSVFEINPGLTRKEADRIKEEVVRQKTLLHRTLHRCKDKSEYPVQSYLQMIKFQGEDAIIIFDTDITSQIALERKQKEQAKIFENISDGVIVTDLEGKIKEYNQAAKRIFGIKNMENIRTYFSDEQIIQLETIFKNIKECCDAYIEECLVQSEIECHKDKEKKIICEVSLSQLRDGNGEMYGVVWMFEDITAKKKQQKLLEQQAKALEYQAYHDALTSLPNRTLFQDRLEQAISYSKRNNKKFALLFIDLDRFKQINDSMGHQFGDQVLLEVANRIMKIIREEDTLARFGGDEFLIIARDIQNKEDVKKIAHKILESLKEPMNLLGHDVYTSLSIGIALYPQDSQNKDSLIKYADSAMYKAKEEGRNTFRFYSSEMTEDAFEKVVMENALRAAIEKEEFFVHFQPQIDIEKESISGVEALVRWRHADFGLIAPGRFLGVAEESGLIVAIDRIVMKKAMSAYVKWRKEGYAIGRLSLNLAMKQLLTEDFLEFLHEQLKRYDFKKEWLEFEVTESDIMRNPQHSIELLQKLHDEGISIAMDDFGTGYSSLAYLTKLPLDKLKIDRSFVVQMTKSKSATEIVKVVIALASTLGLDLVAEGVEECIQKDFLYNLACRNIQGYLYSPPLDVEAFERYLKEGKISETSTH